MILMFKSKLYYLLIFILFSSCEINGQTVVTPVSAELEKLYGRLIKIPDDSTKIQVNDSIKFLIESYVESDSVFNHRFSNLRYLGQITSPDSLIKIVSWNLVFANRSGRYYTYIIRKQNAGMKNLIYRLNADYNEIKIRSDTTYSADNWYGTLYYDIRPQTINGKTSWVILGIDYGNPLISRKLIDVIDFTQDDKIIFGMRIFSSSDSVKYREVFEYSSEAAMSLRFANDGSIVFDHLVPFSPELANDRQYYGPHYSNDAYVPEQGLWKFKLSVDARNIE